MKAIKDVEIMVIPIKNVYCYGQTVVEGASSKVQEIGLPSIIALFDAQARRAETHGENQMVSLEEKLDRNRQNISRPEKSDPDSLENKILRMENQGFIVFVGDGECPAPSLKGRYYINDRDYWISGASGEAEGVLYAIHEDVVADTLQDEEDVPDTLKLPLYWGQCKFPYVITTNGPDEARHGLLYRYKGMQYRLVNYYGDDVEDAAWPILPDGTLMDYAVFKCVAEKGE